MRQSSHRGSSDTGLWEETILQIGYITSGGRDSQDFGRAGSRQEEMSLWRRASEHSSALIAPDKVPHSATHPFPVTDPR